MLPKRKKFKKSVHEICVLPLLGRRAASSPFKLLLRKKNDQHAFQQTNFKPYQNTMDFEPSDCETHFFSCADCTDIYQHANLRGIAQRNPKQDK
jgi:hypothetical protein